MSGLEVVQGWVFPVHVVQEDILTEDFDVVLRVEESSSVSLLVAFILNRFTLVPQILNAEQQRVVHNVECH